MKALHSFLYLLFFLIFISNYSLHAQPPQSKDTTAPAFSRFGTHISGFQDYIKEHEKELFKRTLVSPEELENFLTASLQGLAEENKIHPKQDLNYDLTYIKADIFQDLLELNEGKAQSQKRLKGTKNCFLLKDGRYAFELYNGNALLIEGKEAYADLKNLAIIRTLGSQVHWRLPLSAEQSEGIIEEGASLRDDVPLDSGKLYSLFDNQLLFVSAAGEAAVLYSDMIPFLQDQNMLDFYQSEAAKYLSNRLVDGDIHPALDQYLIMLNYPQIAQVKLRLEAKLVAALSDSSRHIYKMGKSGFLLHHQQHQYARYFEKEDALNSYLNQPFDGQADVFLEDIIQQYGDSLALHAQDIWPSLADSGLIAIEKLDGSMASLDELAIAMDWQQEKIFNESIALGILAYTGEVLKKTNKGKWVFSTENTDAASSLLIRSSQNKEEDVLVVCLSYWPKD